MSDSLRDRIAAAIEQNLADQLPSDLPDRYYEWIGYDTLADAVIAALEQHWREGNPTSWSRQVEITKWGDGE